MLSVLTFRSGVIFIKEQSYSTFQSQVAGNLFRHSSILDLMTKNNESLSRIQRAIARAVTECGCITIHASKQQFPNGNSLATLPNYSNSHLDGALCDQCLDVMKNELGNHLFYLSSICNALKISMDQVIKEESSRLSTLGVYTLR